MAGKYLDTENTMTILPSVASFLFSRGKCSSRRMLKNLEIRQNCRLLIFKDITEPLAFIVSVVQDTYDKNVIVDLLSF